MRATARDVARHPTWLAGWWLEWPCRRWSFWRLLLFDNGQGWLRWGRDFRTDYGGFFWDPPEPPEEYPVAPPLRRAAMNVYNWLAWLLNRHGYRDESPWPGICTAGFYRDADRSRELWGW